MSLSPEDLKTVRAHVGDSTNEGAVSDQYLSDRYDELDDDIDALILEELNRQRANLLADPAHMQGPEGISQDTRRNIEALNDKIQEFKTEGGTQSSGGTNVTKLTRTDYR